MTCRICGREARQAYCSRHSAAYASLEEAYPQWRYALGLTWVGYLEAVSKVRGTGRYVREVASDIIARSHE